MRETLRVGGPVWAHSDIYMPKSDNRSSHRQGSWSTAVTCQRLFPHPVNPATEDHRSGSPAASSRRRIPFRQKRSAGKDASRWSALGPHGIGNRWSSTGTSGHGRQVRIAGHGAVTAPTSHGEAAWRRVRAPPPPNPLPPVRSC
jgi:hypothetical protein